MAETAKMDFSNMNYYGKYIDWKNSYGKKIPFTYNGIKNELTVLEKIDEQYIYIGYKDRKVRVSVSSLKKGIIKSIVYEDGFTHEVGEIIKNKKEHYIIKNRYMKEYEEAGKTRHRRMYECLCFVHDFEFELSGTAVDTKGSGCPICRNSYPVLGYNTLYDVNKDILQYLENPDDAKNVLPNSNQNISCRCPSCYRKKSMIISNLNKNGFHCDYCSDGLSYPNKFVTNFLSQLNIEFEPEKTFSWSDSKIYDHYVESVDLIIENHGPQHYEDSGLSRRDEQENDLYKRNLADANGVKHYIELDCRESTQNHIKNSIMNSELPELLSFSEDDIDWNKCNSFACKNITKEVWNDWNKTNDYYYLRNKYNFIQVRTIRSYIDKGIECGGCSKKYYAKDFKHHLPTDTPIYSKETDTYYSSIREFASIFGNRKSLIGNIKRGIERTGKYKGYTIDTITQDEYNYQKETNPSKIYNLSLQEVPA